jgi:hypothetical protein
MVLKRQCFMKMCDDEPVMAGKISTSGRDVLACVHHKHVLKRDSQVPLTPENITDGFMDSAGNSYVGVENPPQEKLFLVCDECGEAFDTLRYASNHTCTDDMANMNTTYTIKPESEAM